MKDSKKIICISCPLGCELTVGYRNEQIEVSGNKCNRGTSYGKEEFLEPKRIVTAVVKTNSLQAPYIPVKTDKAIKKEYISDLLNTIYEMQAEIPLKSHEILIENFKNTKVNVIFTRSIKK